MNDTISQPKWMKWGRIVVLVLLGLAAFAYFVFHFSPWPSVLLLRFTPGGDGLEEARLIEEYVPDNIASVLDEPYGSDSPDERLDVFYPAGTAEPLPTIVWVHGGAFITGTKNAVRNYLMILASHGYTVVNVEYSPAPEQHYPTQVNQVGLALEYLNEHADRLHIDPGQYVLAGDSSGAQMVAQMALAITNPDYAQTTGLTTTITPDELKGIIVTGGPYDVRLLDFDSATFSNFLDTVLWAYLGARDFQRDPRFEELALPAYVTSDYPPSFITTGPYDPLLSHSEALADALTEKGVSVETLFFPAESTDQAVGHEYQFALDTPEAQAAMKGIIAFVREHTDTPTPMQGVSDAR